MKPFYRHDCINCTFLGCTHDMKGNLDWYVCGKEHPTLLARYENMASGYWSMPVSTVKDDIYLLADHAGAPGMTSLSGMMITARFMLRKHDGEMESARITDLSAETYRLRNEIARLRDELAAEKKLSAAISRDCNETALQRNRALSEAGALRRRIAAARESLEG